MFAAVIASSKHFIEYVKDPHGGERTIRVAHTHFRGKELGLIPAWRVLRHLSAKEKQ